MGGATAVHGMKGPCGDEFPASSLELVLSFSSDPLRSWQASRISHNGWALLGHSCTLHFAKGFPPKPNCPLTFTLSFLHCALEDAIKLAF